MNKELDKGNSSIWRSMPNSMRKHMKCCCWFTVQQCCGKHAQLRIAKPTNRGMFSLGILVFSATVLNSPRGFCSARRKQKGGKQALFETVRTAHKELIPPSAEKHLNSVWLGAHYRMDEEA